MNRVLVAALLLTMVGCGKEEVKLTLVPGRSIWEHADRIATAKLGTRDEVLALAADEQFARAELGDFIGPSRPARPDGVQQTWLEGFVYPETWFFPADATARDVLERAIGQFKKVWSELGRTHASGFEALAERGFTPLQIVTLASLVEEETADRSEAKRIAGVFYNRLAKGMKLETDPTLMYRPDRVAKKPTPAERKDASNPYNTYAIAGLPPGPICSPGKASLEAVLAPETHDYLFFVARRDGTGGSAFAATLDEHEANIDRYLRKAPPKP